MSFQKSLAIGLHETLTRNAKGHFHHLSTLGVVHFETFHLRRTSSLHNEEDGPMKFGKCSALAARRAAIIMLLALLWHR
jgi:hypothetical protein